MTIPTGHILVKARKGNATHNGDGRYRQVWRLWSDGTVQRTDWRSIYQPPFTDELVPHKICEVAHAHGVTLRGFRERGPLGRSP